MTILYAPTHRSFGRGALDFRDLPGFVDFIRWAESADVCVLYRGHPASEHVDIIDSSAWSYVPDEVCPDISDLLPLVDVLITDYSSVFYDFLTSKSRAIFLAPDIETYRDQDQGFYVDYSAEVPGPIVKDWDELIEVLANDWMGVGERVADFRLIHTQLADGGASDRIVQLIQQRVKPRRSARRPISGPVAR